MLLSNLTDQCTVRSVHQEGTENDTAEQITLIDQWEGDVIQVGMAGKNVGFSQFLSTLSSLYMEGKAFVR